MKKTVKLFTAAIASVALLASCTTTNPITATSNPVGNKCGEASATVFLGILGGSANCGINAAAKKGGITKISHVDWVIKNYGIVKKFTVRVYGE